MTVQEDPSQDDGQGLLFQRPEADLGRVGARRLVCVQTLNICRLNSQPVPLPPDGLIMVSGRGPDDDSNGCGKTTFAGAVSLLLGDPGWRTGTVVEKKVTGLLFRDGPGGAATDTVDSAIHGYVLGVFVLPEQADHTALTVWCRINATNADGGYLQSRVTEGNRLAHGSILDERLDDANQFWASMPRHPTYTGASYAEALYGRSSRCQAYVTYRGDDRAPSRSLLEMKAAVYDPHTIAEGLIALTGDPGEFDQERDRRRARAHTQQQLHRVQEQEPARRAGEDAQLREIAGRDRARTLLAQAQQDWQRFLARQLTQRYHQDAEHQVRITDHIAQRDALETDKAQLTRQRDALDDEAAHQAELDRLTAEVEQAHSQLVQAESHVVLLKNQRDELGQRITQLRDAAGEVDADLVESARAEAETAHAAVHEASWHVEQARRDEEAAEAALDDVEAGRDPHTREAMALLAGADITGYSLLDQADLDEQTRQDDEPRLWLLHPAVVVACEELPHAREVLADLAGTTLIGADTPTGQQPDLTRLRTQLAMRMEPAGDPVRVRDAELDLEVIGGFSTPITGRVARVHSCRQQLQNQRRLRQNREYTLTVANDRATETDAHLVRVETAAALLAARGEHTTLSNTLTQARRDAQACQEPHRQAQQALRQAESRYDQAKHHRDRLNRTIEEKTQQADNQRQRITDEQHRQAGLQLDRWHTAFGGSFEAAAELAGPEVPTEHLIAADRVAAVSNLEHALGQLEPGADTGTNDTPGADVLRRVRQTCTEIHTTGGMPLSIAELTGNLERHLAYYAELDHQARHDIQTARAEREARIEAWQRRLDDDDQSLQSIQRLLDKDIRRRLQAVENNLNQLWGQAGRNPVTFTVDAPFPTSPEERWYWQVRPHWQRSALSSLIPYGTLSNDAEVKLFNAMLVLAALLTAPDSRGRTLIVDELGDSLARNNLRLLLRAVRDIAGDHAITIMATCQDMTVTDAAAYCDALLFFRLPESSQTIADPAALWAYSPHTGPTAITLDDVLAGRPLLSPS